MWRRNPVRGGVRWFPTLYLRLSKVKLGHQWGDVLEAYIAGEVDADWSYGGDNYGNSAFSTWTVSLVLAHRSGDILDKKGRPLSSITEELVREATYMAKDAFNVEIDSDVREWE